MCCKALALLCVLLVVLPRHGVEGLPISLFSKDVRLDLTTGHCVSSNKCFGFTLSLKLGESQKLSGRIGKNFIAEPELQCNEATNCVLGDSSGVKLNITVINDGFNIEWISNDTSVKFLDCVDLNKENVNWFGGPELLVSEWPIENMKFWNAPYRSSKINNSAVSERYWLNSNGGYVFVDDKVPLFVDQNNLHVDSICFEAKVEEPYLQRDRVTLQYAIVAKSDPKEAQKHAVANFLGKPTGRPNSRIIKDPIWTTWAKYKVKIDDDSVREFARDIAQHNFTGQLEIDDYWETCYGSAVFNDQFKDINETVKVLKDLGFTVTLWTHPFVNDDCKDSTEEGRKNGYFVKSGNGNDYTKWWNGDSAHHIDFTKPSARKWFTERLRLLQDRHGIDSFKFDAGENDWAPEGSVLTTDNNELSPNVLTSEYVRTCATFGDLIEVRSAFRSQDLPVLVRMIDKDSRWGLDNGLHNLITTLLQMNINGYGLVLPDMIGGNGYGTDLPTSELMIRWTQANVFMPTLQFSYLPWEFNNSEVNTAEVIRKFVNLHEEYADEIIKAIDECVKNGTPVNAPIWWLDPTNPDALNNNDEYLLGEKILVAPVIRQGAISRDVILPKGSWIDGNQPSKIYEGPIRLLNYDAPIDVLPYFIKQ